MVVNIWHKLCYSASMSMKKKPIFERILVPAGQMIINEGDEGNCAYLIQAGRVRVFTNHAAQEIELARLEAGDIFGERSLLFGEPRSASVQATMESNVIRITRSLFEKKLEQCDPTIRAIVGMLSHRLENSNETIAVKKASFDDLVETNKLLYNNILNTLPDEKQRRIFQDSVLSKLEDFTNALRSFRERNC